MARVPQLPYPEKRKRHNPDTEPVIKPTGKFERPHAINITTDRSPEDVTSINTKAMKPILPQMVYIPPA